MLGFRNSFSQFKNVRSELIIDSERIEPPYFSICIPTYRRPDLLIEAVLSAVNQHADMPHEIVIVDNEQDVFWSSQVDKLLRGLNAPQVRLFRNSENLGMFGNWNRCLELSQGKWVSILNDDDLLAPNFLSTVLELINQHPEAKLIQTGFRSFSQGSATALNGLLSKEGTNQTNRFGFVQLSLGNPRAGCLATVYDREAAIEIGGFNPEHFPTADVTFNMRFLRTHRSAYETKKPCALYRIQDNESQKPNVLAGFIKNDFLMRLEAAREFRIPFLMKLYARVILSSQLNYLEHTWRAEIDQNLLPTEIWRYVFRSKSAWFASKILTKFLYTIIRAVEEKR